MKIFCYHKSNGMFWFRLFGYGLAIKNIIQHKLLFSERYNYSFGIKIKNYYIRFLNAKDFSK
jgi:hypothetical protein